MMYIVTNKAMSQEGSTDNVSKLEASELEVVAAMPRANEQSAKSKLMVSFDDNLDHDVDGHQLHSRTHRTSSLEQSWHRKDSSTRVKDSNKLISFHDIVYQVPVKKWCREQSTKVILHGVRYTYAITIEVLYC